jgi:nucleoside-diphosphate-sugar epimerase
MSHNTDWRKLHGSAFNGAKVLITGGAGFIGSHLAEALSALGANVIAFDDLSAGNAKNIEPFSSVRFVQGSILDFAAVEAATKGCQYVFHQAARASVPLSVEKPWAFYETNVTGTFNVLQAARAAKVKRVMFAASSSAYGESEVLPKVETMPQQPLSPYAASKVANEGMMRAWANCYGFDTVALRYFNIFGPRQTADSAYAAVIAAFAKAMLTGKQPTIHGDGEHSRDFTFVHNAVHANLLAARSQKPLMGDVFNVATARRITLNHLAKVMCEQLDRPDLVPIHGPPRAGDIRHSLADLDKIKETLGYEPIVDFESGLGLTLDWYKTVLAASTAE